GPRPARRRGPAAPGRRRGGRTRSARPPRPPPWPRPVPSPSAARVEARVVVDRVLQDRREVVELPDRTHLDPAVDPRAPFRPLERLLGRTRLDDPVAADDLLGLGEGTVDDPRLAPL